MCVRMLLYVRVRSSLLLLLQLTGTGCVELWS